VASDEHSLSIGPDGPLLLQDHYLIEQMANFNRERIPERQPHAKGSGRPPRNGVTEQVLERAFEYWKNVDKETGEKIEAAVRNGSS
jgi:catalase